MCCNMLFFFWGGGLLGMFEVRRGRVSAQKEEGLGIYLL